MTNVNERFFAAVERAARELPRQQQRPALKLIQAAPDLLIAAKLAIIEFGYVKGAELESNALVDLRAAVAKAEGKN